MMKLFRPSLQVSYHLRSFTTTTHKMAKKMVWVWGDASEGQCGVGENHPSNILSPYVVGDCPEDIDGICAGEAWSYLWKNDLENDTATIWGTGSNNYNILGELPTNPASLNLPSFAQKKDENVVSFTKLAFSVPAIEQIKCGRFHTVIQTKSGRLLTFGSNNSGQLGQGPNVSTPEKPGFLDFSGKGGEGEVVIKEVGVGGQHNVAIDSLGRGWGWGNGMMFVLGTGNEFPKLKPTLLPPFSSPSSTSPPSPLSSSSPSPPPSSFTQLVSVSCGLTHTVTVGEGGEVVGWGDSRKGQLGKKKVWMTPEVLFKVQDFWTKEELHDLQQLEQQEQGGSDPGVGRRFRVVCGESHTVVYAPGSNKFVTFGANEHTQLTHPHSNTQTLHQPTYTSSSTSFPPYPTILPPHLGNITKFTCGGAHTIALTTGEEEEGEKVVAWGCSADGQCGVGKRGGGVAGAVVEFDGKRKVGGGEGEEEAGKVVGISAGWGHNLAMTSV